MELFSTDNYNEKINWLVSKAWMKTPECTIDVT